MKVLITGANGLLGTPTVAAFRRLSQTAVIALGYKDLDITDAEGVQACLDTHRPDLVINCAAFTRVDDCESNEALARRVNGDGAGYVAHAAARIGVRLIHISTDYVFDGSTSTPYTPDDPTGEPATLCAYGRSKLLGEQRIRQHHSDAIIVRTAWLYGSAGPCFPRAILDRALEGQPLRVVEDQIGSPTYAPDLADALCQLSQTNASGLYHVTNTGRCSWYEFAGEILRQAGLDASISPVTSDAFPRPAKRPSFSMLDNHRFVTAVGQPLRRWQAALEDYLTVQRIGSGPNRVKHD